jgi:hypothetical protein
MRISLLAIVFCIGAVPVVAYAQSAEPTPMVPAPETVPAAAPGPVAQPAPVVRPTEIRDSKNALFVELFGSAGTYSINYERFIGDFSARLGFSYLGFSPNSSTSVSLFAFPLTFGYLGIHGGSHHLDLGLGAMLIVGSIGKTSTSGASAASWGAFATGTAIIGYRYAPLRGGFMFRAAFTPMFAFFGRVGFQPWGGLAFGYVF